MIVGLNLIILNIIAEMIKSHDTSTQHSQNFENLSSSKTLIRKMFTINILKMLREYAIQNKKVPF